MGNCVSSESNFENIEGDILKLIGEIDALVESPTRDKDSERIKKNVKGHMEKVKAHNKKVRQFFEKESNGFVKIVDDFAAFKVETTALRDHVCGYHADNKSSVKLMSALRAKAHMLKDKANELQDLIIKRYPDAAKRIAKRIEEIEAARKAPGEDDEED